MKKTVIALVLIFLYSVDFAQIHIKELEDSNISEDHLKEIKIYRLQNDSFSNIIDSIMFDNSFFDKKYNLDTFDLYKQVLFDSCTGKITCIRTDFYDGNKRCFETKYLYNSSGFCAIKQGSLSVYNALEDHFFYGQIASENYIYNSEGRLKRKITLSVNGETFMKRYFYDVSSKCDIIVMTYANNLPFSIYFYVLDYYNPFKEDDE